MQPGQYRKANETVKFVNGFAFATLKLPLSTLMLHWFAWRQLKKNQSTFKCHFSLAQEMGWGGVTIFAFTFHYPLEGWLIGLQTICIHLVATSVHFRHLETWLLIGGGDKTDPLLLDLPSFTEKSNLLITPKLLVTSKRLSSLPLLIGRDFGRRDARL